MKRRRFEEIYFNIQFSPIENKNSKKIEKIRPFIDLLETALSDRYYPTKDLSIDESLLKFKGKLAFKQFIPTKRARFGVKIYKNVDSNGVLLRSKIYCVEINQLDNARQKQLICISCNHILIAVTIYS